MCEKFNRSASPHLYTLLQIELVFFKYHLPEELEKNLESLLGECEENHWIDGAFNIRARLAKLYLDRDQISPAMDLIQKIRVQEISKYFYIKITYYNISAYIYFTAGDFEKSLEMYQIILDDERISENPEARLRILYNYANNHLQLKNYDSAIAAALETQQLAREKNDRLVGGATTGILSNAYLQLEKYNEAFSVAVQGLSDLKAVKGGFYLFQHRCGTVQVLIKKNKLKRALKVARILLKDEFVTIETETTLRQAIVTIYHQQRDFENAFNESQELNQLLLKKEKDKYESMLSDQKESFEKQYLREHAEIAESEKKKFKELLLLVESQNARISAVLKSIKLGIMVVRLDSGKVTLGTARSLHLSKLFDVPEGTRDLSVYLDQTDLSNDAKSKIDAALHCSIEEDVFAFELNSHLFPLSCLKGEKFYEIGWAPIISNAVVTGILISFNDVTEIKLLKKSKEERNRYLSRIGKLLEISAEEFDNLFKYFSSVNDRISALKSMDIGMARSLFIDLHTLKGTTRQYKLDEISDGLHSVEDIIHHYLNTDDFNLDKFQSSFHDVWEKLLVYSRLNFDTLKRDRAEDTSLKKSELRQWIKSIDTGKVEKSRVLYKMRKTFMKTLREGLDPELARISSTARKLGKLAPRFSIVNDDFLFEEEFVITLKRAMVHLFRNSIDHGIEEATIRNKKGLPSEGLISIGINQTKSGLKLEYYDDGPGLSIKKIFKKALSKKLVSPEASQREIANTIFHPNFSTTDKVTDISGGGVGMDAVKAIMEEIGCTVELELLSLERQAHYTPFKVTITIPKNYYFFLQDPAVNVDLAI